MLHVCFIYLSHLSFNVIRTLVSVSSYVKEIISSQAQQVNTGHIKSAKITSDSSQKCVNAYIL